MSHGLQVFDKTGNLAVSLDYRLIRFISSITVNIPGYTNYNQFVSVPGMSNDLTWAITYAFNWSYEVYFYSTTLFMFTPATNGFYVTYDNTTNITATLLISIFRL